MGGHHKKNLRAEKAKVKLKGAKLPKGLNVTKTDFKVRKIEIRGQLKESVFNDDGHRQLSIKELLSRLKHHSLKFRTEALRNVRDCVKAGQCDRLIGHLNELLQGIAAGALDVEGDVRKESFKTLDSLLEALQPEAVAPFFHVLSTYLRCSMTHVLPAIQEDSLLMLDVLLHRVPADIIAERCAHTIIGNFIDMISLARHDNERSNRTLIMRLGQGQQTTIKWRTKVLLRLQQILGTLVQQHQVKGANIQTTIVNFDTQRHQYYGVLRPLLVDQHDFNDIFTERTERNAGSAGLNLRTYVEQLMPLLQDNWLEVRPQQQAPQQKQSTEKVLLTAEAAASLFVLLDIMAQLWSLVTQYELANNTQELSQWMRDSYAAPFVRHFLEIGDNGNCTSFPYEQMPQSNKKQNKRKANDPTDGGEFCTPQNLCLAELMCRFYPHPANEQASIYARLLEYMLQCLQHLDKLSPEQQLRLVSALNALLLDSGASLLKLHPQGMCDLLQATIEAYVQQRFTTREGVSSRVLNLLCLIVQNVSLYTAYGGADQFLVFLRYLPQLLLKPTIGDATLRAMSTLCQQLNVTFMTHLVQCVGPILTNLERLQLTGAGEADFEGKKRILNLFYYARTGFEEKLQAALKEIQENTQDSRISSYFACMLTYI